MHTSEAASEFCKWAKIPHNALERQEADKMLGEEADEIGGNAAKAAEHALERMKDWWIVAADFRVDWGNLQDIAKFVASHRRACVWTVAMSLHHNTKPTRRKGL